MIVNVFSLVCSCVIHCYRNKNPYEKVTSVTVCAEVSFSENPHYLYCNQLTAFFMIGGLFTERYSRTDHNVFLEIHFNKNSHYIATSQFIYTANQLTGFCEAQVSTERHFQTYIKYIPVKPTSLVLYDTSSP